MNDDDDDDYNNNNIKFNPLCKILSKFLFPKIVRYLRRGREKLENLLYFDLN